MAQERSFRQILEEKLHSPTPAHPGNSGVETAADLSPEWLEAVTQGLDHLGASLWTFASPRGARRAYPARTRPSPRPRMARGPGHSLSDRQKDAWAFFASFGENLAADFTAAELKGAYRRLALRLHPDVNTGGTGPFLELIGHLKALESLFKA